MSRLVRVKASNSSSGPRSSICGDGKTYLFGRAVYPPNGHYGPLVQAVFELVILIRGHLRVTVDRQAYDLFPGDAILQHPGAREFYRFSSETESEHTFCQVYNSLLSAVDRRLIHSVRGVHRAPSAVHVLIEEGLATAGSIHAELHQALAALARSCLLRFAAHANTPNRQLAPARPAFERALTLATTAYPQFRSAADLALCVGLSPTRLRTLFQEAGHESPSSMIWRLKVERAIQLIRSTGLTLGEIADDCGYANPFHLSRSVRRHTGCSPRELRQNEWKEPRGITRRPPP